MGILLGKLKLLVETKGIYNIPDDTAMVTDLALSMVKAWATETIRKGSNRGDLLLPNVIALLATTVIPMCLSFVCCYVFLPCSSE